MGPNPGSRRRRVRQIKEGKRRDTDRKLYPGYVFIELELDKNGMIPEKVWFMIKETDGVGDFIGSNGKPTPMSPKDQAKMLEEAERPDDAPDIQTEYKKGDRIKVTEGAVRQLRGRRRRDHPRQGHGPDHRHDLRPAHAAGIGILADREDVGGMGDWLMSNMIRIFNYAGRFQKVPPPTAGCRDGGE